MLARLPDRKIEIKVYLFRFWVYQGMIDVIRAHEVHLRSCHWVCQWKINLKFENGALVQSLFDKVHSMPLRQAGVKVMLYSLSRILTIIWLMRIRRHHKHADNGVFLQQFEIKFQYFIPRLEFLKILILLWWYLSFLTFIFKMIHELFKSIWYLSFFHIVFLIIFYE